jgi:hypothetical protein
MTLISDLPTGTTTSAASAKARPVILVHGWTNDAGTMDTIKTAINADLKEKADVHSFDFSPVNDVLSRLGPSARRVVMAAM